MSFEISVHLLDPFPGIGLQGLLNLQTLTVCFVIVEICFDDVAICRPIWHWGFQLRSLLLYWLDTQSLRFLDQKGLGRDWSFQVVVSAALWFLNLRGGTFIETYVLSELKSDFFSFLQWHFHGSSLLLIQIGQSYILSFLTRVNSLTHDLWAVVVSHSGHPQQLELILRLGFGYLGTVVPISELVTVT